jgi:hypothetical protein
MAGVHRCKRQAFQRMQVPMTAQRLFLGLSRQRLKCSQARMQMLISGAGETGRATTDLTDLGKVVLLLFTWEF